VVPTARHLPAHPGGDSTHAGAQRESTVADCIMAGVRDGLVSDTPRVPLLIFEVVFSARIVHPLIGSTIRILNIIITQFSLTERLKRSSGGWDE
jgi:hypothetical protein